MRECLELFRLPESVLPRGLKRPSDANDALCALIAEHKRDYPARNILKFEGDDTKCVFLLLSGWLLASKSLADGQRQIIDVVLPGGLLEATSADIGASAMEIEALVDISIARIPRRAWHRACREHPELWELNHQMASAARSRISERMLRLGKAPAETTIAYTLCELCLRSSKCGLVEGAEFHIPMTQQQLGDLCGLSAVHICRTLRRLERNGVLSVTDHMDIVVHDMKAMAGIAEIDPEALRQAIIPAA